MYLKFFGLSMPPFSVTPDMEFLYLGKQHELAMESLLHAIDQRHCFSLLTGEVGTGKTTLSRALLSRLDPSVATALLINPLLSVPELLKAMAKDFGISNRYTSPQRQIEALNRFLVGLALEGKRALVVIDEAQNLSYEALETIRMLTNLETDKQKLLQILIVGQPELIKKLKRYELRQVDQRISTRVHLEPLSLVEMMRYINHRISIAGGTGKVFFESKAYRALHREAKGYPRLINFLCDRALMASYIRESYVVDKKAVGAAIVDWKGTTHRPVWQILRRFVFS